MGSDQGFGGRVAVVTGAANGIGRAIGMHMAERGATVALLDIEEDALADTANAISIFDGRSLPLLVDMTDRVAVVAAFLKVTAAYGPIDILVNNVGQTARERLSAFADSDPDTWEFVIRLSLMSTLLCTRQVAPAMRDRRSGKIVNIASDAPLYGSPHTADYSAAKLGVVGFTRTLARELGPFAVNVNAVSPGITNTRGPRRMAGNLLAEKLKEVPLGSMCEPEDIANAVGFLASDAARFITGQNLVVNGRAFV
jgi:acetoacetyl-CoA reductase/3-oxoacyl-[acyl-carrier protein] reductase